MNIFLEILEIAYLQKQVWITITTLQIELLIQKIYFYFFQVYNSANFFLINTFELLNRIFPVNEFLELIFSLITFCHYSFENIFWNLFLSSSNNSKNSFRVTNFKFFCCVMSSWYISAWYFWGTISEKRKIN